MTRRFALAVSISLVCLAGVCGTARGAFPGADGRISFTRFDDVADTVQIFTVDPSGVGPVAFAQDSANEQVTSAWSPDGTRIAFADEPTGGGDDTLVVANADGTGARPVRTESGLNEPSWSPDGHHVVYIASPGLEVVDVDSADPPVTIPGSIDWGQPAWSPRGDKIAIVYFGSSTHGIATINPDGSGFQPLTELTGNSFEDEGPAWSPDGSTIYFAHAPTPTLGCESSPPVQILMIPAAGGSTRTFSQDPSVSEYDAAPSPAGDAVAFARCDDPSDLNDHVWLAAPDGSSPHALTSGTTVDDEEPSWQPTAPKFGSQPSVSGSPVDNQTLTATAGSSPGGGTTTLAFYRCDAHGANCVAIPGATATRVRAAASSATYKLTALDIGRTVRVRQTQTNAIGTSVADSLTTAAVIPSKGHCSNRFAGTARADRIKGSAGSDRISGGRGKDRLSGLGGADCISGGAGNDVLSGGKGNDTLSGGAGNDTITAGPGSNRVSGGAGNDRINVRNHRRDVVNCGKGKKDRVVADKRDKLRGCELVKKR
jgi:Tol biopolymer transport system component